MNMMTNFPLVASNMADQLGEILCHDV